MAVAWWYTDGRSGTFECATDADFLTQWSALPDDGVLAFKFYYDVAKPDRLGMNGGGTNWYWLQPTKDGIVVGQSDDSSEEIALRYPGAILKRGQWTTLEDMERVVCEQAKATYWGDAPIIVELAGCCGN